jgi:hypothetical protein
MNPARPRTQFFTVARGSAGASVQHWAHATNTVFCVSKINPRGGYRAFAKSHRSSGAVRLRGVAKVHTLRCGPENTQVATGIHDPRDDAIALQNFDRAIDSETLRDSAEIN